MYRLYLKQNGEQLLLPVTPAEIETRTGNQNKTAYILDFRGDESGEKAGTYGNPLYGTAAGTGIQLCADGGRLSGTGIFSESF